MKRKLEIDNDNEASNAPPTKKVKNKSWSVSMIKLKTPGNIVEAINKKLGDEEINKQAHAYFEKILERTITVRKPKRAGDIVDDEESENDSDNEREYYSQMKRMNTDEWKKQKSIRVNPKGVNHEVVASTYSVTRKSSITKVENEEEGTKTLEYTNNGVACFLYWLKKSQGHGQARQEFLSYAFLFSQKSNLHSDFLMYRDKNFAKRASKTMLDPERILKAEVINFLGKDFNNAS